MQKIVHHRVEMARSLATGQGVTVARPSSLAAAEIRRWVDEVEDIVGMHTETAARAM